jgi:hypothetical protein
MAYGPTVWGADVPVSHPEPLEDPNYCLVDMGGFGFGVGGIAHNYTTVDHETIMVPFWSPLDSEEAVPY